MESSRAGDGHRECPAVGTGPDNQSSPVGEPSLRRDLRAGSAEDSERGGRAPPRGRSSDCKGPESGACLACPGYSTVTRPTCKYILAAAGAGTVPGGAGDMSLCVFLP